MGLLLDILAAPFMAPMKMTTSLAEKVHDMAIDSMTDEQAVHRQLLELQMRYELGELEDAEFEREEQGLVRELDRIRRLKEMNLKRGKHQIADRH